MTSGYMAHPGVHPEAWRKYLKHGNHGPDVAAWQATLLACGYDINDQAGEFLDSTHNATLSFQRLRKLAVDGIVGGETKSSITARPFVQLDDNDELIRQRPLLAEMKFRQAKNYTRANRTVMGLVVLHSMEGAETATKAESVARWFAGQNPNFPAPRASAHYAIDSNSIVQMVREADVAWAAPGANRTGIHLEHAGRARQIAAQWMDDFSKAMLLGSAWLTADICLRRNIPIVFVDRDGLSSGLRGITTHNEVTHAFRKSTHTDPGKNFPMDWYLEMVREAQQILQRS